MILSLAATSLAMVRARVMSLGQLVQSLLVLVPVVQVLVLLVPVELNLLVPNLLALGQVVSSMR